MERVSRSMLKEQRVSYRSPVMTTLGPGADSRVGTCLQAELESRPPALSSLAGVIFPFPVHRSTRR